MLQNLLLFTRDFIPHYLKGHLNSGGFVTEWEKSWHAIVFTCSNAQYKIVQCWGHLFCLFFPHTRWFSTFCLSSAIPQPSAGQCKVKARDRCGLQHCKVALHWTYRQGRIKCRMLSLLPLSDEEMNQRNNLNNSGQQSNTCNWPDCVLSLEGDKSKYGFVFSFHFMTAILGRLAHHFLFTRYRPGISVHTSKNWKKSWLFKESAQNS